MASCLDLEQENCQEPVQNTHRNNPNEILLFHNNKLVLKAERGVTLGLLKLIYSSDDHNNGIVLGVKPRTVNEVPCLVTFDNTSLMHDAYDLIIKDLRSDTNSCTESNNEEPSKQLQNPHSSNSSQDLSPTGEMEKDMGIRILESSSTNTNNKDLEFMSGSDKDSNDIDSNDDSMERELMNAMFLENEHPTPGNSSFENNDAQDVSHAEFCENDNSNNDQDSSKDGAEEENDAENSCNSFLKENSEKLQFEPEEFGFDIKSVIPTKTDKGLRWPCDRCGKDYCSSSHLKRHWILHTDFKPYKCRLCGKSFPFHWDLKRHMTKHTGIKRFKCPHCTKSFNTKMELKCHNWLHTGQKQYKCEVCHHEISSSGNLKIHMRKHTGEKPYKCEYCPKTFYMLGHYQYHIRRHTGEKPYKCDVCGMAFSYSLNLTEHKNIHTGVKPHSCPTCDKRFTHRSTLKQHILTHTGQRPYKCHLCSKNFVQNSNYRNHLLTHKAKKDRAQKCDLCGKELLSRRGVKKHRQRCVQALIDRANGVTIKKPDRKNKTKERYECGICSKLFTYRANYETHCRAPHPVKKKPKPKNSSQGPKATSSRGHSRVGCPICGKQFLYVKCLKTHLQQRHAGVEVEMMASNTRSASTRETAALGNTNSRNPGSESNDTSEGSSRSRNTNAAHGGGKLPVIVRPVPTVHIQPEGAQSSSNVILIYVPSKSTQSSSTTKTSSLATGLPKPRPERSEVGDTRNLTAARAERSESQIQSDQSDAFDSSPANDYSLPRDIANDKGSGAENGSQAITALKILSAKIGIEDQFQALSSRTDEQRPPISKHLSALEQLSKRVGVDGIPVSTETAQDSIEQSAVDSTAVEEQVKLQNGDDKERKQFEGTNLNTAEEK